MEGNSLFLQLLTVVVVSATPVIELRGAIPLGIGVFSLPVALVMTLAFFGNMIPVAAMYLLGGAWLRWTARRTGFLTRLTDKTVHRARRVYDDKRARYGALALPFFVAVPLPLTGAVTGAIAAFIFGVPFRRALLLIAVGVAIADVLVTLATLGVVSVFGV